MTVVGFCLLNKKILSSLLRSMQIKGFIQDSRMQSIFLSHHRRPQNIGCMIVCELYVEVGWGGGGG